jgi:hypothetical protein
MRRADALHAVTRLRTESSDSSASTVCPEDERSCFPRRALCRDSNRGCFKDEAFLKGIGNLAQNLVMNIASSVPSDLVISSSATIENNERISDGISDDIRLAKLA